MSENTDYIRKYVLGIVLCFIAQHYITLFAPGVFYELYVQLDSKKALENPLLLWDLNWKFPFNAVIVSILFLIQFLPLAIINITIISTFLYLEKKLNTNHLWSKSISIYLLSMMIGWVIAASLWWGIYMANGRPDLPTEVMNRFEFWRPGSFINVANLIFGNLIFLLGFLPFWVFRLSKWNS